MKRFLLLCLFLSISVNARELQNTIKTTDENLGAHAEDNQGNIDRYREDAGRGAERAAPGACAIVVGAIVGSIGGAAGGAIGAATGLGGGVCGGHR